MSPNNDLKPGARSAPGGAGDLRTPKPIPAKDVSRAAALKPARGLLLGLLLAVVAWGMIAAVWYLLS